MKMPLVFPFNNKKLSQHEGWAKWYGGIDC